MSILGDITKHMKDYKIVRLGEIFASGKKGTLKQEELIENGEFPVINSGREFYGYYDKYNNENAIAITSRGEYAGFIHYHQGKFWAGGLCHPYSVKSENDVNIKFIYYYLKYKEQSIMENLVSRGSIPALNKVDIDNYLIPLPPLTTQLAIVEVLDKFTELEKELEKRKLQYQYYRDKLLTFTEEEREMGSERGEDWGCVCDCRENWF